jgi:hypothetical protein
MARPGRPPSSNRRPQRGSSLAEPSVPLYLAFLGRPNGPRAGWLLAKLEPEFVGARLREAAAGGTLST